ncbi:MAG: TIGR04282 family arsenosugar biosynthesis glycosyltransferase [Pseudomonadota bacterium]
MSPLAVILFLRVPEKGLVKTRLSRGLDEHFVLELYKAFVQDALVVLQSFESRFLFFWPPGKKQRLVQWLGDDYTFMGQYGDTIGEKMANAFEVVFEKGFEQILLIGTDIPEISEEILIRAGQALGRTDAVIGPCRDGGYYLIGFTKSAFSKRSFQGINWSSSKVLVQTMEALKKQSIQYELLDELDDIDTLDDLSALNIRVSQGKSVGSHTLAVLTSHDD